jgi:hypothetical protein
MKLRERWKRVAVHNRALVYTGSLVAVGTLFYTGAAIFQTWLLNKSVKETAEQTERSIGQSRKIAGLMEESLAQAKIFLERSITQSQLALNATMETSRRDQRAWLTIDAVNLPKPLAVGENVVVLIQVRNSGKTPAREVGVLGTVISRSSFSEVNVTDNATQGLNSRLLVGPNTISVVPLDSDEPVRSQVQIDLIMSGPWRLYAKGIIVYRDIFNLDRHTSFCFFLDGKELKRGTNAWAGCAQGNWAD